MKSCVKCDVAIARPVLADGVDERCANCGDPDGSLGEALERVALELWRRVGGEDDAMSHGEPDAKAVLITVASFLSCLAEDIENVAYVCEPGGTLDGLVNGIEHTMARVQPR
jgi:hypothetical protein